MLLADLMIALQGASVKLAAEYFSSNFLVFIRFGLNLVFLLVWLGCNRKPIKHTFYTTAWKYHAIRSLGGVGAIYGCYLGLVYLPISPATLLFFSFPVFTPLVTRIWLKIEIQPRLWWGLGMTFLGLVFVLKPGAGVFDFHAFIPLGGAVLAATAGVAVRKLHYTDSTNTILLYFFMTGVGVAGILQLFQIHLMHEVFHTKSVILLLLVGVFSTGFQWLYTAAARYGTARLLSPFLYLSFIFTTVEDIFIWKLPVHLGIVIGFFLLLAGTTLYVLMYPKET